jgi:hypothetical protein
MKHLTKILTILIPLSFILLSVSCSNDTSNKNNPIFVDSNAHHNYFFNIKSDMKWNMNNQNGDSAYFESLDTALIKFVPKFWDIDYKEEMLAIPIEFVYWEGNNKKRQHFALGITKNGYMLMSKNNAMIGNYALDYFSYYFTIPNEPIGYSFNELTEDKILIGINNFNVSNEAKWNNTGEIIFGDSMKRLWRVEHILTNELKTPQKLINNFIFIEASGFYQYMGYELVGMEQ